jgi:two-component system, response regulator
MNNYDIVDILIVEDNPQDAELTIRALRKHNLANNLFVLEDGADAVDFIFCRGKFTERSMNNQPKIILLDLKLPKLNGLEVLKTIKSDKRTALIPIVAVTSSQEEPDMKEAYKLGVNSYVVKPLDFDQFTLAMSSLGLYWLLVNKTLN